MKVLLLQDIKWVGRKMEIKNVSDGYARNFLIAKKLAIPADQTAIKIKSDSDAKEQALVKKYQDLAKKLESESIEFFVKTGPKGEMFGSIGPSQIQKTLEDRGFGASEIVLEQPIKSLGKHKSIVKLGRGIQTTIEIIVSPASR
ncbi:MAG: 50S ribosomal protein L9 [Patescibacteria group bacterium]